jgi:outer membrane protein TolC
MYRKPLSAAITAVTLILAPAHAAFAADEPLKLTLKEAVRLAITKNLDVKAELYNPAQAEADIRRNRAIYETHLTLNSSYQDSTLVSTNQFATTEINTFKLSPGAFQLFPTGGTLGVTFNNTYTDTNSSTSINPATNTVTNLSNYWQSNVTFTLNQPLLKNFGRDTTELNIQVAELGKEGALQRYKGKLLAVVAQVRSEYHKLYSLRKDLESRKASLDLAQRILSDTEARVKAGVLPAMEILNAQFGVASREKELIDAEKAVRDEVDVLQVLLQFDASRELLPVDPPELTEFTMNEEESVRQALAQRPELDDLKSQLTSGEIQTRVAHNRTRPDLNLTSSLALTGLAEGYGRNMERVGSADYPVWTIGIQLDYPLGNSAAENDYIKSRLKTDQIRTQLDSLKSSIASEVRTALRNVKASYKQLDVADRGRAYAEERLKAYLKKSEVGLATTKDVLDVENDLSAARTNQIKAQVVYTNAISQFLKTTGQLLEREGITVSAVPADELYGKAR